MSGHAWRVAATQESCLTADYACTVESLSTLYAKGKQQQWDAAQRIDWSQSIDFEKPLTHHGENGQSPALLAFKRLGANRQAEYRRQLLGFNLSQFLHGEQGALLCASKIVQVVPDHQCKQFAATQVVDEARHVEVFARVLAEKVDALDPIDPSLKVLLGQALSSREWDYVFLGMQVVIESLAMASFALYRDLYTSRLLRQVTAYVMEDEARHVAFGRVALRGLYAGFTEHERSQREEFLLEACRLMNDRVFGQNEVQRRFDLPLIDATGLEAQVFRRTLFVRLVPTVRDVGLWSERLQAGFRQLGILKYGALNTAHLGDDDARKAQEIGNEQRA